MDEGSNHYLGCRKTISLIDIQGFKRIGGGKDGEVYQLTIDKCIKIYHNMETQRKELKALLVGQSSTIIPRLFRYGDNYIVMEYINGISLANMLKKNGNITRCLTHDILFLLTELKRIGFNRIDTEIRHILITKEQGLKVIDHKRAFSSKRTIPRRLLQGLQKYNKANEFLNHVKMIEPIVYQSWLKLYRAQ